MKRNIFVFIVIFFLLYFLFSHINDDKQLFFLIKQAKWEYLFLAIFFQIIYYIFYALLYQKSFAIYTVEWKLKQIIPLVLASMSISIMAPLGSLAGAGIFIRQAKEEKLPAFAMIAGLFTVTLVDFLALFIFLTLSIIFLTLKHDIFKYELGGYVAFIGLILGIVVLLSLGAKSPKILKKVLKISQLLINKIGILVRQKVFLTPDWAEKKTQEFSKISNRLIQKRKQLKNLMAFSLLMHLSDIITVFLLFLAFGHFVRIEPLLIGYSLGVLFWIVSPTPQGVGVVESVMPLVFGSLGVDIETATLVTLTFRGLTLWLPILLGFITLKTFLSKKTGLILSNE